MTERPYQIVVGVDGSDGGTRALTWAVRQAAHLGGTVLAVAVWTWDGVDAAVADPEQTREQTDTMLAERIAEATRDMPEVPVTPRTVLGLPADALVAAATGADLLVLGSHGHGRLFHAVLGSVADRCVRAAACPVVVVPVPRDATAEPPADSSERPNSGMSGVFY